MFIAERLLISGAAGGFHALKWFIHEFFLLAVRPPADPSGARRLRRVHRIALSENESLSERIVRYDVELTLRTRLSVMAVSCATRLVCNPVGEACVALRAGRRVPTC